MKFLPFSAPSSQLIYIPVVEGTLRETACSDNDFINQEQKIQELIDSHQEYKWADSKNGFFLKIKHINEDLGIIIIKGFTFPEHRHHYLNLALSITQVMGLAIDNSRKYDYT